MAHISHFGSASKFWIQMRSDFPSPIPSDTIDLRVSERKLKCEKQTHVDERNFFAPKLYSHAHIPIDIYNFLL